MLVLLLHRAACAAPLLLLSAKVKLFFIFWRLQSNKTSYKGHIRPFRSSRSTAAKKILCMRSKAAPGTSKSYDRGKDSYAGQEMSCKFIGFNRPEFDSLPSHKRLLKKKKTAAKILKVWTHINYFSRYGLTVKQDTVNV